MLRAFAIFKQLNTEMFFSPLSTTPIYVLCKPEWSAKSSCEYPFRCRSILMLKPRILKKFLFFFISVCSLLAIKNNQQVIYEIILLLVKRQIYGVVTDACNLFSRTNQLSRTETETDTRKQTYTITILEAPIAYKVYITCDTRKYIINHHPSPKSCRRWVNWFFYNH